MINKIFSTTVYNLYSAGIKFLTFLLISKLLSKDNFGLYNFFLSFFSLSSLFIIFGFHRTIFKFKSIQILGFFLKISFLTFIIYFTLFSAIQYLNFFDVFNNLKNYNYILLYVFVLSVFSVFFSYFRVLSLLKIENIYTKFLYPTIFLIFLIFVFSLNVKLIFTDIYIYDLVIMSMLIFIAFYFHKKKFSNFFLETKESKRKILQYSSKILIINVLTRATFLFDILFIGFMLQPSDVAEYSIALKLTLGITIIVSVFSKVFEKNLSKTNNSTENIKKIINLLFTITVFVSIVIFLFYSEIIYFFGKNYENIKIIFVILMISKIIDSLFGLYIILLLYKNQENIMIMISSFSFILSLVLNYIFILSFGLLGAAYASLISILLFGIMSYSYINKINKINFFSKNLYFWIVSTIIIVFYILFCFLNIYNINFYSKSLIIIFIGLVGLLTNSKHIKILRQINE